jgi:hypothetical protein
VNTQHVARHPQKRVVRRHGGQPSTGSSTQNNKVLQQLPEPANCLLLCYPEPSCCNLLHLLLLQQLLLLLTLLHLLPVLLLSSGKWGR